MADENVTRGEAFGLPAVAAAPEGAAADVDRQLVRARAHEILFAEPPPTIRVGRYVVLDRLGAGGMGVVYSAYDPALDRKVAVKVLRSSEAVGQQRLLREARALAKLTHDHVVAVHDVGTVGGIEGTVFIAMELVSGATLGEWIAGERPGWRTRLEVVAQAGRGLAAAHAAGLVHRDFKPDNVMVARDTVRGGWRARVMDFGLVHAPVPMTTHDGQNDEHSSAEVRITRQGVLVGTPAYMAAEQLHGAAVDARADQFAFCVTLWEALFDVRPFHGRTPTELASALVGGAPTRPATSADIPAWVERVLLRGLSTDPADRFPDMPALLAALGDDPSQQRRRWALGLGAMALVGALVGGWSWMRARERAACAQAGAEIDRVWSDDQRERLRTAIVEQGPSYGGDTWTRVEPSIDDYAGRWSALREESCLAALAGERSRDLADRSEACLDERRVELAATVDRLGSGDALAIREAVPAVLDLSDVERCGDAAWLVKRRPEASDPDLRRELDGLRSELVRASRLPSRDAAQAADVARTVLMRANELSWAPMRLDALVALARALATGGDFEGAAGAYRDAFALAVELGDDDVAATSSTRLVFNVGYELGRQQEGALWSDVARAFLARSDPEGGLPTAWWLGSRGALASRAGRFADALADFEQAAAIRERIVGLDHPQTLKALANTAVANFDLGDYEAAATTLGRVASARARLLGPEHPEVATAMASQAAALGALGRPAEALATLQRALAIEERALGPMHPELATTLQNIGLIQAMQGDHVGELATQRRQLSLLEAKPDTDPVRLSRALVAVAMAQSSLDHPSEALPLLLRARALLEGSLGVGHPDLALCLDALALAQTQLGRHVEALVLRRRVLEIRTATLGSTHPDTALARRDLGAAAASAGDLDLALLELRTGLHQQLTSVGVKHREAAVTLRMIGIVHQLRGDSDVALPLLRSALALQEHAEASEPTLASTHDAIGRVLLDLQEPTLAAVEHRLAVELATRSLGAAHSTTAGHTIGLADAERAIGRLDDAEDHARGALATLQRADSNPELALEAELVLSEILRAQHRSREARDHLGRACGGAPPSNTLRLRRCPGG
ncbi:MAG: serine/threonine protein kinase [Deltaproteobacteria bacterium]|nr:serine/threonine protein kinase [Deltaproteobacteria bacterium]MBP7286403.1 serine/threonine protein kinase [Nannocystaceae bacterium]